jgi:hypothetical protein
VHLIPSDLAQSAKISGSNIPVEFCDTNDGCNCLLHKRKLYPYPLIFASRAPVELLGRMRERNSLDVINYACVE